MKPNMDEIYVAIGESDPDSDEDWYVLGAHTRRAVGYMGAALAVRGYLPSEFEQPILLELWSEALLATAEDDELSPIGDGMAKP